MLIAIIHFYLSLIHEYFLYLAHLFKLDFIKLPYLILQLHYFTNRILNDLKDFLFIKNHFNPLNNHTNKIFLNLILINLI